MIAKIWRILMHCILTCFRSVENLKAMEYYTYGASQARWQTMNSLGEGACRYIRFYTCIMLCYTCIVNIPHIMYA
jgi:hypothetical protein